MKNSSAPWRELCGVPSTHLPTSSPPSQHRPHQDLWDCHCPYAAEARLAPRLAGGDLGVSLGATSALQVPIPKAGSVLGAHRNQLLAAS